MERCFPSVPEPEEAKPAKASKPKAISLPYFTPDKRQCLILGNIDYSAIRFMGVGKDGNPKELGFADLPEV